ncbi:SalX ABC-type antimicrobial peptide transport system, ATPase component [Burkholderiales bacterium]
MTDRAHVLEARGLSRQYEDAGRFVRPFQNVSLSLGLGETLAIMGPSGAGKSTLLQLLGGLDQPSSGEVFVDGESLQGASEARRAIIRNTKIGFVYQFHHLLPEFSALENVAMPLRIRRMPVAQAHARAQAVLQRMGLEQRMRHRPYQLSGGERQRVAIARALVTEPRLVLADEPTGNLDREAAHLVFDGLMEGVRAQSTSLVVVTHDPQLGGRCDRSLVLSNSETSMAR